MAFGFVFWLLLDLIQGAYDLRRRVGLRRFAMRFIAIGVSAAAMWMGVAGQAMAAAEMAVEIAKRPLDTPDDRAAGAGLFRARHVQLRLRGRLRHSA